MFDLLSTQFAITGLVRSAITTIPKMPKLLHGDKNRYLDYDHIHSSPSSKFFVFCIIIGENEPPTALIPHMFFPHVILRSEIFVPIFWCSVQHF